MSPEERVRAIRRALLDSGGKPALAAQRLDCSRNLVWHYMLQHGMRDEPRQIRRRQAARYAPPGAA